jgi:hypothetical protein
MSAYFESESALVCNWKTVPTTLKTRYETERFSLSNFVSMISERLSSETVIGPTSVIEISTVDVVNCES